MIRDRVRGRGSGLDVLFGWGIFQKKKKPKSQKKKTKHKYVRFMCCHGEHELG
jgi:hypothetical protein